MHTPSSALTHTFTYTHPLSHPIPSPSPSPSSSHPIGACTQPSNTDSNYWTDTSHTWSGNGYFPKFPASSPYVTAVGATSTRANNGNVIVTTAESNQGEDGRGGKRGGGDVRRVTPLQYSIIHPHTNPMTHPPTTFSTTLSITFTLILTLILDLQHQVMW